MTIALLAQTNPWVTVLGWMLFAFGSVALLGILAPNQMRWVGLIVPGRAGLLIGGRPRARFHVRVAQYLTIAYLFFSGFVALEFVPWTADTRGAVFWGFVAIVVLGLFVKPADHEGLFG